jgi:RND family efflux transporter MFP subunit
MKEKLLQPDRPEKQHSTHEDEASPPTNSSKQRRQSGRLKLFLFLGLACLAVLAVFGIMTRSATTEKLQQQANQASTQLTVSVVKPEKMPANISIDLPGQTQAYVQAPVYAQASGYLKKWYFDIGSRVKKGDVLAEVDTPQVDQQLNQAKATLNQAQAALDLSRSTYQRDQELVQRKVIAQQDFDTAVSDLGVKQATVNADEAAVRSLQALEDFKIVKAPFDGIVSARNTDIGAMINSGSGNALFVVAQIKPLRVYISVPESMAQDITIGAAAELRFNEFPGRAFAGKIVRTAGAIDPSSRTLLTEVDVANDTGELFPGAYTQVHLVTQGRNPSLLVPANALVFGSEGTAVGVVNQDNTVQLKKIKIGRDLGTKLEITQGLDASDQVIINPSDSIASGQKVKVRPSQEQKKQTGATPAAKNS